MCFQVTSGYSWLATCMCKCMHAVLLWNSWLHEKVSEQVFTFTLIRVNPSCSPNKLSRDSVVNLMASSFGKRPSALSIHTLIIPNPVEPSAYGDGTGSRSTRKAVVIITRHSRALRLPACLFASSFQKIRYMRPRWLEGDCLLYASCTCFHEN